MAGLYVQLDVEYSTDPKMIDAGPMAELLYVRSLCFAKRTMKDGYIARSQLPAIAVGIPKANTLAARLVDVGAWDEADNGWHISGWLKRNKPAAEIRADREARALKSAMGNHERWHVKEGRFDPTCRFCNPYEDSHSDPKSDPKRDPKGKGESEGEPEGKGEGESRTSRSTHSSPSRGRPNSHRQRRSTTGQPATISSIIPGALAEGTR